MISTSLRFTGDLPPWLVILSAVIAAVAIGWIYQRETRTLALPYSYLLPALRAIAVALVILILAGPVLHRRMTVGTLGRVVFAVDASASMSVSDSGADGSNPSRLHRALRLLAGDTQQDGWLSALSRTHDVDVVEFSSGDPALVWSSADQSESSPNRSAAVLSVDADGRATDLAAPLSSMLAQSAGGPSPQKSALVIFSDGRDNSGGRDISVGREDSGVSAIDLAGPIRASGGAVFTIGMGSRDEPTEVAVVSVDHPDTVASDGKLAGAMVLDQFGMTGSDLTLQIQSASGGEVFWQKVVPANSVRSFSVPFELDVASIVASTTDNDPRSVHRNTSVMDLRAVVQPTSDDTTATNNSVAFRVAASTRNRRLLILDGSSRWEMRYIRNLFERDPAWAVDTILFGPGTDRRRLKRGDAIGEFPKSRESMSRYDVIVLGEIPPEQFEAADANLLREFVTRGGGLVVIDGRYERVRTLAQQHLGDLIPVKFVDQSQTRVRSIAPTPSGLEQPSLNLTGESSDVASLWKQLPPPTSASIVDPQIGAEVWADVLGDIGQRSPWLVTRLFGAGRVVYLSSDQTWRWRYKVADRFHARFWNQLLAAVMQPPYSASDDYVAIGTDKIEYVRGDSATIRARLQDNRGGPVGNATVDALLIANNQVIATLPLSIDDPARGTYQGTTAPLDVGAYDIRVRASGFDAGALQATTPIWVSEPASVEMNRVALDPETLNEIASAGGGQYYHESSAAEVLQRLRPLSSGTIVETDYPVWQSYYWFVAVIAILSIEWFLRKRAGLI